MFVSEDVQAMMQALPAEREIADTSPVNDDDEIRGLLLALVAKVSEGEAEVDQTSSAAAEHISQGENDTSLANDDEIRVLVEALVAKVSEIEAEVESAMHTSTTAEHISQLQPLENEMISEGDDGNEMVEETVELELTLNNLEMNFIERQVTPEKCVHFTNNKSLFPLDGDDEDLVCSITREDVLAFQKATKNWFYNPGRSDDAPESSNETPRTTTQKPEGLCSLYRVIEIGSNVARLQAVTVDLWLPERGDLRVINLTLHAKSSLDGERFNPETALIIGDLVFVQSLRRSNYAENEGWKKTIATSPFAWKDHIIRHSWNVIEYQLIERSTFPDTLAVALKETREFNGQLLGSHLLVAVETRPELIKIRHPRKYGLSVSCAEGTIYFGTLLAPAGRPAVFSAALPPIQAEAARKAYIATGRNKNPSASYVLKREANKDEIANITGRDVIYDKFIKKREAGTEWLRRGFCLAVPVLAGMDRTMIDRNTYTTHLKIVEKNKEFINYQFTLEDIDVEKGWSSKSMIYVMLPNNKKCFGRIRCVKSEAGADSEPSHVVTVAAFGIHGLKLLKHLLKNPETPLDVRLISWSMSNFEETFYSQRIGSFSYLQDSRFHRGIFAVFGGKPVTAAFFNKRTKEEEVQVRGETIRLRREQGNVLEYALTTRTPLAIKASFGCGKTLLGNILLGYIARQTPEKVHVFAAQSNFAVISAIRSAEALDGFKDLKIVRLITPQNLMTHTERTRYDLPSLMMAVFSSDEVEKLPKEEKQFVKKYLENLERLEKMEWEGDEEELSDALEAFNVEDHPLNGWKRAVKIFVKIYQPKRIFTTIATLLGMASEHGPLGTTWALEVMTLLIDEASQLSAPMLALLGHCFRNGRPILIGDPRQLSPYSTPKNSNPLLKFLATGNVLATVTDIDPKTGMSKWPTLALNDVFRCHPKITSALSDTFYGASLNSAVTDTQRGDLLKKIVMPSKNFPIALIQPRGNQIRCKTSLLNTEEANVAAKIARFLAHLIGDETEVAVICLYKSQSEAIAGLLQGTKVFVATADASQGREFMATIICTTRSKKPRDSTFFCEPRRVNVALSRAKELVLILGERRTLQGLKHWNNIMEAVGRRDGAVTDAMQFFDANGITYQTETVNSTDDL